MLGEGPIVLAALHIPIPELQASALLGKKEKEHICEVLHPRVSAGEQAQMQWQE